jgi:hypothetical protein
VAQLAAQFEQATQCGVAIDFAPAPELRERIAAGEAADAVILPQSMMDELASQGKVAADSRAFLWAFAHGHRCACHRTAARSGRHGGVQAFGAGGERGQHKQRIQRHLRQS